MGLVSLIVSMSAVVLTLWFLAVLPSRDGVDRRCVWSMSLWGLWGAFWGGHLLVVLSKPSLIFEDPLRLLNFLDGAKGVFGAFMGAALFGGLYLAYKRQPVLVYADAALPAVALGYAVARVGCFLNGDDFGTVTSVPWAVQFPPGTEAFAAHVAQGWVTVQDAVSLPVHPTQLYHAGAGLVLFLVLRHWQGAWPGQQLAMALLGYGGLRFVIEWFRGDAAAMLGPLHLAHIFSLLFMAAGASLWWWNGMRCELRSPQHAILAQAEEAVTPMIMK